MRIFFTLALMFLAAQPQQVITARRRAPSGPSCAPFTDNFTRANGPLGANWSGSSSITIVSNSASIGAFSTGAQADWAVPCTPGSSYYSQFVPTIPLTNEHFGAIVLATNTSNYVYVDCTSGGGCNVFTLIAGTPTFINNFSNLPVSGQTFCFEVDSNTTVKLKMNGTYDPTTITLTGGLTGGSPGIIFLNQDASPVSMNSYQAAAGTCP